MKKTLKYHVQNVVVPTLQNRVKEEDMLGTNAKIAKDGFRLKELRQNDKQTF